MPIEIRDVKTWGDLKEWLADQSPSVRIKVLKLILNKIEDKRVKDEAEKLIKAAEEELIDSEEWKKTLNVKKEEGLEDLFPTLAGQEEPKKEELPEIKSRQYIPQKLLEELEDLQLMRPVTPEDTYITLTPEDYHAAATKYKTLISEAYLKLSGAADKPYSGTAYHTLREVQDTISDNLSGMAWAASGETEEAKKLRKMMLKSEQLAEQIIGYGV